MDNDRFYRVSLVVPVKDPTDDPERENENVIRAIEVARDWLSTWSSEDP